MCDCVTNFTIEEREQEIKLCSHSMSQEEEETCCSFTNHLEEEGRLIICIGGLIFNTFTIVLLFDKSLSNQLFNRLLLCLVIAGNVHLLLGLAEFGIIQDPESFDNMYFYFIAIYPLRDISMLCIIFMTVVLSLQRYNSVINPQANTRNNSTLANQNSWKEVLTYTGPVMVLALLFKLPLFFEVSIKNNITIKNDETLDDYATQSTNDNHATQNANNTQNIDCSYPCLVRHVEVLDEYNVTSELVSSVFRNDYYYLLLYRNIANLLVTGVIPFITLAYLNFRIYNSMKTFIERRRTLRGENKESKKQTNEAKNQRTQTAILFSIVVIFVICHIPRIVLNIEELILESTTVKDLSSQCRYGHSYWYYICTPISETLLKLNSSVNFFVYCVFNQSFRNVIHEKFSKACNIFQCQNCKQNDELIALSEKPRELLLVVDDKDKMQETKSNVTEL